MKYVLLVHDFDSDNTFEFKINTMVELQEIMEIFKDKHIEVDLYTTEMNRKLKR